MTLDEMKLAVSEKLPELIELNKYCAPRWRACELTHTGVINWPTEGLQVCHEAEKLLGDKQWEHLVWLRGDSCADWPMCHATYEQRLEALCRVWFPERFSS